MGTWIVETTAFRTAADAFESAVRDAGDQLRRLSPDDEHRGHYGRFQDNEAVIFRGSFEAAASFRRARPDARPGVIGDPAALRCSAYFPGLGDRLLNADHALLPLGELRARWPELQARFGVTPFVRPDSGAKAFSGQVVADLDRFEARERPYLEEMAPGDLVVVAAPRKLVAEWRTVVVGREVVAGSRYKKDGQRDTAPEVPADARAFAQEVAATIAPPALAYMLDVAQEESGRLSIVELNAFSCSDLYACDPRPVVMAVRAHLQP